MLVRNPVVVGANGFVGKNIAHYLLTHGYHVTGFTRKPCTFEKGVDDVHYGNTLKQALKDYLKNAAHPGVIHAAGTHFGGESGLRTGNIDTTRAVVDAISETDPNIPLVYISSVDALMENNTRGKIKKEAEQVIIDSDIVHWHIMHCTTLYGPNDYKDIGTLIQHMRRSPFLFLPGGMELVQPFYIDDLSASIHHYLENFQRDNRSLIFAGQQPCTVNEVVAAIQKEFKLTRMVIPIPLAPLKWLCRSWVFASGYLGERGKWPIEVAHRELRFRPRPLQDGIHMTVKRMREQGA